MEKSDAIRLEKSDAILKHFSPSLVCHRPKARPVIAPARSPRLPRFRFEAPVCPEAPAAPASRFRFEALARTYPEHPQPRRVYSCNTIKPAHYTSILSLLARDRGARICTGRGRRSARSRRLPLSLPLFPAAFPAAIAPPAGSRRPAAQNAEPAGQREASAGFPPRPGTARFCTGPSLRSLSPRSARGSKRSLGRPHVRGPFATIGSRRACFARIRRGPCPVRPHAQPASGGQRRAFLSEPVL